MKDYLKGFKQRIRYVSWVNEVLQSHQASTLDEFRVNFDPDSKSSPDIDNWIEFAIQKRVQRLEVGMKAIGMTPPFPYEFRTRFLFSSKPLAVFLASGPSQASPWIM